LNGSWQQPNSFLCSPARPGALEMKRNPPRETERLPFTKQLCASAFALYFEHVVCTYHSLSCSLRGSRNCFSFSSCAVQWRVLQVMNDSDLLLRKGSKRGFFSGGARTPASIYERVSEWRPAALSQPNAPWAKINWLDFIYESGEQAEIGK
jgi:hypothetical protein